MPARLRKLHILRSRLRVFPGFLGAEMGLFGKGLLLERATVADGVGREAGLAFGGAGPGAELGIFPICLDLLVSGRDAHQLQSRHGARGTPGVSGQKTLRAREKKSWGAGNGCFWSWPFGSPPL